MTKRMLIDATHLEEKRIAIINNSKLEEFDFETTTKQQIKGNIYLAKVIRVEPSLQAAFVDYGGNRHGFLAFAEIHPDYYRIPIEDRNAIVTEEPSEERNTGDEGESEVETIGGNEEEMPVRHPTHRLKGYKIQDVIKRRQIMLVQVVKEERNAKGAALTTFLSLAGRYCVLMPNAEREGGVSRKITNSNDRKRLKTVIEGLDIPENMGLIIRTAGMERSKVEIKRDCDYLLKLWDTIRETTLQSTAPTLIYQEADLIKRAIRDLYSRDIDEIWVEGEEGYKAAKNFMKTLIPTHAKKVQLYQDQSLPIFHYYNVENMVDAIHSPVIQLKSGGYIVINPTEALVSIDVNSGKATRERHIEETAFKTNLEAAEEIALQLRLRDLAGLIVIDFIDMDESKNIAAIERRLKEAMANDRARIQIGRISHFGLLELSRQRLRSSVIEASTLTCPHCQGTGHVRSTESSALHVLRAIEEEGLHAPEQTYNLKVPSSIALYLLNQKRQTLIRLEEKYKLNVIVEIDDALIAPNFVLDYPDRKENPRKIRKAISAQDAQKSNARQRRFDGKSQAESVTAQESADLPSGETRQESRANGSEEGNRRRSRRRRRRTPRNHQQPVLSEENSAPTQELASASADIPEINTGKDAEIMKTRKGQRQGYSRGRYGLQRGGRRGYSRGTNPETNVTGKEVFSGERGDSTPESHATESAVMTARGEADKAEVSKESAGAAKRGRVASTTTTKASTGEKVAEEKAVDRVGKKNVSSKKRGAAETRSGGALQEGANTGEKKEATEKMDKPSKPVRDTSKSTSSFKKATLSETPSTDIIVSSRMSQKKGWWKRLIDS